MNNDNRTAELVAALRERLTTMHAGDRLPSMRTLAAEFQASPVTVQHAITALAALGLVRAEPGRGTFVTGRVTLPDADVSWQSSALGRSRVDPARAARLGAYGAADDIQLSWGYLAPELQPLDELRSLGARAARSRDAWAMAPATGLPELRRVLAAELGAEPGDVLVLPGGQQGLVFAMRTLADPGQTVITESPSYPGAIIAAQAAGLELAAVPSDADGIRPDKLADALERTRASLIYLQPSFANPSGATLSPDRRVAVLELARRHGAFIIEDDWARHLALSSAPPPPPLYRQDPHGHVVTLTTLTKPIAPGLRIGALAARGPAGERLRTARVADDMCVTPLTQEVALGLLTSPAWPRHLGRLRRALRERRDAMVQAIHTELPDAHLGAIPEGGIHLWAELPVGTDTTALAAAAQADGVLIGNGRHYFVDEPTSAFIRLSFSAASVPQIHEGVRRLAPLLRTAIERGGRVDRL